MSQNVKLADLLTSISDETELPYGVVNEVCQLFLKHLVTNIEDGNKVKLGPNGVFKLAKARDNVVMIKHTKLPNNT